MIELDAGYASRVLLEIAEGKHANPMDAARRALARERDAYYPRKRFSWERTDR